MQAAGAARSEPTVSVTTAFDLLEQGKKYPVRHFPHTSHQQPLGTGCALLDEFLDGGFHEVGTLAIDMLKRQGITEISGEAGVGKSQLCMQLLLQVSPSWNSFETAFDF